MRNTYLEDKKNGALFGVNLHSTERGRSPYDDSELPTPLHKINLRLEHHFRARKMPKILESYKPVFNQTFLPDHFFYFGPQEEPHSEMMTLELINEPKYVKIDQAETVVRHFLDYMISATQQWNKLQ